MSGVLKTIGAVAGLVAAIPSPIQPYAAAIAVTASIAGSLTAKKPKPVGSSTNITIGARQASPCIIGRCYHGGGRVAQVGYGSEDGIPNAYAGMVDIYSVGGPLKALLGVYADFTEVTYTGTNANGYYNNNLHRISQLGAANEAGALTPHWAGMPGWGASHRLSGKAAILHNARFPAKGSVFRSGLPQFGAIWEGVLAWDPRSDSTWPGGAGTQRWAAPANTAAFAAAKATWMYSTNPGVQALRYALGTWERDETNPAAPYQRSFGMALPIDGIVVDDFIEFANVCDANGWSCAGVLFEPGDRWENLKNVCAAGAAEPCIKGGLLGLRITAPRVSLDTITRDDLVDDEISVPETRSYRDRLNTIVPKYKSSDHKWEYVATSPVQVTQYVTDDGEERSEERQFNMVAGGAAAATQVAQLGAYELVEGRQRWPIELTGKPRLRRYGPGSQLIVDIPEAGLIAQPCVILRRRVDPATMKVSMTLMEEIASKHAYALAQTGTSPPAISIAPPESHDGAAGGDPNTGVQAAIANSFPIGLTITAADTGAITISAHTRRYTDGHADVAVSGATIASGLASGTVRAIGYDDLGRIGGAVTYQLFADDIDARVSPANPGRHYVGWVQIPAAGGTSTGSGALPPGGNPIP